MVSRADMCLCDELRFELMCGIRNAKLVVIAQKTIQIGCGALGRTLVLTLRYEYFVKVCPVQCNGRDRWHTAVCYALFAMGAFRDTRLFSASAHPTFCSSLQ